MENDGTILPIDNVPGEQPVANRRHDQGRLHSTIVACDCHVQRCFCNSKRCGTTVVPCDVAMGGAYFNPADSADYMLVIDARF